jgi:alkylhydroperoxidase family enzyme
MRMARLSYLDENDLQEGDREILQRGLNLYRLLAHSPGAARAFQHFAKFLRFESSLDPRIRELAILQVGYIARVEYSFYGHVGFVSGDFGVSFDDLKALIADSRGAENHLEPKVRFVLKAAREMTATFTISDETFAELRPFFSPRELTDLIATIAFYNAALRFITTMQIDIEDQRLGKVSQLRTEFPLPRS